MSKKSTATLEDQRKAASFVSQLKDAVRIKSGETYDSASGAEVLSQLQSRSGSSMPDALAAIVDGAKPEERGEMVGMILDSCAAYERRNGRAPTGDVLQNAFAAGASLLPDVRKSLGAPVTMDSANNAHHDQISLRPNAPIIGTTMAIVCAVPFAYYAPVDAGGNEGRIIILNHAAENAAGEYAVNESIDGVNSGDVLMSSERTIALVASANMNGQFRAGQTDLETADVASPTIAVLRGRTIVFVNGLPVARENVGNAYASTATSALQGQIEIEGVTYVLGGTINPTTGAINVTSAPALPALTPVHATAYLDFERGQELLAARVTTTATVYSVYASADRGIIRASVDSQTQFEAEIGYSPLVESSAAARTQYYNERHYRALRKMYRVGKYNGITGNFDFDWTNQGLQKERAQIWRDFSAILFAVSQAMANRTIGSSIAYGYVPKGVATQLKGLPREFFEPSGIGEQPGMYRVGRLFGQVEIYYCPKLLAESPDGKSGEMLFIGRNEQAARSPIIIGDAVAPAFKPLGTADDMKEGYGFYSRGFLDNNPHLESQLAAALITYENLY